MATSAAFRESASARPRDAHCWLRTNSQSWEPPATTAIGALGIVPEQQWVPAASGRARLLKPSQSEPDTWTRPDP